MGHLTMYNSMHKHPQQQVSNIMGHSGSLLKGYSMGAYDSTTAWHLCLRDLAGQVPLTMGCACSYGYYCGIDDDGKEGVLYWL